MNDHLVMCSATITTLPIEIFEGYIFPCLSNADIKSFGNTGIKRFEDIANEYLKDNSCK